MFPQLLIIGGGTMGAAILRSAISGDRALLDPSAVTVCELDAAKREVVQQWGVSTIAAPAEVGQPRAARQILWAVKPQFFAAVGGMWRPHLHDTDTHISIMAGVPIAALASALGSTRVVRVMTNTPAQIGLGTTAVALAPGAADADAEFAMRLFAACSTHVQRVPESMLDAFTALVGSGPAYLDYLAEAMIEAAPAVGIPASMAEQLVRSTLHGAVELWLASEGATPAQLRAAVTSKGGTTAAACETLDAHKVKAVFAAAIKAGAARAAELAKLAGS
ncbi:MAG: pyrroline-5-carboxylate reductase [Phycisphaerales bacterium]